MASLSLPTAPEVQVPEPPEQRAPALRPQRLLVMGFDDAVAADYLTWARQTNGVRAALVARQEVCRRTSAADHVLLSEGFKADHLGAKADGFDSAVLFLPWRLSAAQVEAAREALQKAALCRAAVVLVTPYRGPGAGKRPAANFADITAIVSEAETLGLRGAVLETGIVLSAHSKATLLLHRVGFCEPIVPNQVTGCCVSGEELFAAIEKERARTEPGRRWRRLVLLGANRPWRERLAAFPPTHLAQVLCQVVLAALALLGVGRLVAAVMGWFLPNHPLFQRGQRCVLRPQTFGELLALYNPYNFRHVQIVGYNNGVHHFGHRFPGKTLVSTLNLNRVAPAGADEIKADSGVTIRAARDFLSQAGQELYVIPNFSYVCLGTAYFVPIHGSAADYSCVADTMTRVLLYDPHLDRLISCRRTEPSFQKHAYHPSDGALLLRMRVRVKAKSRYYVEERELNRPTGPQLLEALQDTKPANVEIRKNDAGKDAVRLFKYFNDDSAVSGGSRLEAPRDQLGRLWDRLEENRVTAFLMHALTRHLAYHVELFFTPEEFVRFWSDHQRLPLRKIQLRYIRRDHLPHSPFRDSDCVSSDMFTFRWRRRAVENYLKQTFAVIRANAGKQSV